MIRSSQSYTFEELLNTQGYIIYTIKGFSMLPLLRQNRDVAEIRKKTQGRYNKFDVVLYKRGEKYTLHRILKVFPEGYLITGDHCRVLERDIKDEHILGVMTRVNRNGKDITPDNKLYRLYINLWCRPYQIRMLYLGIEMFFRRCYGYIKRRILGE